MAEQDVALTTTMSGGSAPSEGLAAAVKQTAAPGLPAGIRWWEACGGWDCRYDIGTF